MFLLIIILQEILTSSDMDIQCVFLNLQGNRRYDYSLKFSESYDICYITDIVSAK